MSKDTPAVLEGDAFSAQESFSATEDNELVSLLVQAREGSREAYRLLRLRYRPLFDATIARFSAREMTLQEREDLKEEAERIFLTAISTYDTDQDAVDFGLYAKICLRNGLVSEMRSMRARHRLGIVPLEIEDVHQSEDPANDLIEAESFHKLYQLIHRSLSPFENDVWWRYVSGINVKKIAEQIGKDERSVHNAIYRIRKKLRVLLADEH